ncbi:MAG: glycine dehydrogenase subunit 2 [Lysobacterales bacterium]|jgi:glycine dehydrogenase subunit 2
MELIFKKSIADRQGYHNPPSDVGINASLPDNLQRKDMCAWPEVEELDVIRHFTKLSQRNYSIDTQFYPLGSCTMKYNPRFTEDAARLAGFSQLHPLLPQLKEGDKFAQGALQLLYELEELMAEITGLDYFTMQPLAGAHGELTGVMMMAAYHKAKGNDKEYIIIPDSSHGTNPATASIAGYDIVSIPSDANGVMDFEILKTKINDKCAGLMLTSPNTHGIFNSKVDKIAEMIHAVDGIMYYDGANLNAIMGRCRPGDLGFDVMHINTHKTFTTPHGGGGPGAGPVGVNKKLEPFLPVSRVIKKEDGSFALNYDYPDTIGYISSFYGNFGILLRAFAYILMAGEQGLRDISSHAVLNANYLRKKLGDIYEVAYDRVCMHECVFSAKYQAERGMHAIDVAKFLIDQDIHPPTVYFPMTVNEAIMIEPTETESKQTMDVFVQAMLDADAQSKKEGQDFSKLPETTPVRRPDEVHAARALNTNYFDSE